MRLLNFFKPIKQKVQNKCSREILVDEVFIKSTMQFFEIESVYSKLLDQLRGELETIAVSRAKDAFITIGDFGCLSDNTRTPSGLLKEFLRTPNV